MLKTELELGSFTSLKERVKFSSRLAALVNNNEQYNKQVHEVTLTMLNKLNLNEPSFRA